MKKSAFKKIRSSFRAIQPTPLRGVLDEEKKAHVILLISSGLSRREAAGFVQCAHTTIGRSAARDLEFANKLSQAEATSHVQAVSAIRGAMRDPKYWKAAAWMLERRSPEEYARRDPNSFTADQVMSLLARLYSETLPLLPAESTGQFQELFDDVLDEVEAKSGPADKEDEPGDEEEARRPPAAAHSSNGHLQPDSPPAVDAALGSGRPDGQPLERQEPHAEGEEYVELHSEHEKNGEPHAGANGDAASADGRCDSDLGAHPDRAAETPALNADMERLLTASRFAQRLAMPDEVQRARRARDPLFAALRTLRRCGRDPAETSTVAAFDAAQLHQPFHQGDGVVLDNDDRKALHTNDLQQDASGSTTSENSRGGAIRPTGHDQAVHTSNAYEPLGVLLYRLSFRLSPLRRPSDAFATLARPSSTDYFQINVLARPAHLTEIPTQIAHLLQSEQVLHFFFAGGLP
jgi:hypothetical protein